MPQALCARSRAYSLSIVKPTPIRYARTFLEFKSLQAFVDASTRLNGRAAFDEISLD